MKNITNILEREVTRHRKLELDTKTTVGDWSPWSGAAPRQQRRDVFSKSHIDLPLIYTGTKQKLVRDCYLFLFSLDGYLDFCSESSITLLSCLERNIIFSEKIWRKRFMKYKVDLLSLVIIICQEVASDIILHGQWALSPPLT